MPELEKQSAWTKCSDGTFVAEVSDLAVPNWDGSFRCPACGRYAAPKMVKRYNAVADEVVGWEGRCPHCRAALTFIND